MEKMPIYSAETPKVSGEINSDDKKSPKKIREESVIVEEGMGAEQGRPTEKAIEKKADMYRKKKKMDPEHFRSTEGELENLAEGYDPDGIGKKYFPGWKMPEDFKKLLKKIG